MIPHDCTKYGDQALKDRWVISVSLKNHDGEKLGQIMM
jgi:hypothetical protein